MRKRYDIFADYHQICLRADPARVTAVPINDEDCRRRIAVAPGEIIVMPERNMVVPVTVEIVPQAPACDLAAFDHVVEASLDLAAGRLAITDLVGGFCEVLALAPGPTRIRFAGRGFASLSADGLDGDDAYTITLWPAPAAPVSVLKQYEMV